MIRYRNITARIQHILKETRYALKPSAPAFPVNASPEGRYAFTVAGVALELPYEALSPSLWIALSEGWYEEDERTVVSAILRPGDTVLELGAAIGFMSTFVARHLGITRVVAVEANPQLIPIARRTHALNGVHVELINAVVAQADGQTDFHVHPEFWSSSTETLQGAKRLTLRARSLSGLLREVDPQVLVVDIEGGEMQIFNNAALPGVRAVIIELHREVTKLRGIAQIFTRMASAGFAYDPDISIRNIIAFVRHE